LQNVNFSFFFPKPYFIVCLRLYDAIVTKQSSSHKTVIFRTTNHNIVHTTPTSTAMDRGDCDDINNTRPMTITPKLRKKWGKLWSTDTIRYGTPYINRSHLRSTINLEMQPSVFRQHYNWQHLQRRNSSNEAEIDERSGDGTRSMRRRSTTLALILLRLNQLWTCVQYQWPTRGFVLLTIGTDRKRVLLSTIDLYPSLMFLLLGYSPRDCRFEHDLHETVGRWS